MRRALVLLSLALCHFNAAAAQRLEPIEVAVPTAGLSSSPAPLRAQLYQSTLSGPRPTLVMLHGCGGAYATVGADKGKLNSRHQMWAEHFVALGYNALMVDSFSSRGIKELCTQKLSARSLKEADRVGDAYAALVWLRSHSAQHKVDAARIGLQGWSHGGGVALDAIRRKPKSVEIGFIAAVSFYPGCSTRNKKADSFMPYAPLLLLIGEADDWTPAASCKALFETALAHGAQMDFVAYPDAYHSFDTPGDGPAKLRTDVANGVNPGKGAHAGPNPAARAAALTRVDAFWAAQFK